MNFRSRDPWGELVGVVILGALAAIAAALVLAVPTVVGALGAAGRLQVAILDRALAAIEGLTGWQFDMESSSVRLMAAIGLYGGLAAVLYFMFLVGTHLGGLLAFVGVSALVGILLTFLSGMEVSERPEDYLSRLKFWD